MPEMSRFEKGFFMTKYSLPLAVLATAFLVTSCGGEKYDPNNDPVTRMYDSIAKADSMRMWGPPTVISYLDATDTTERLNDMRVSIEGYVSVGTSIYETETSTSIQLWERPGQHMGEYISIGINLGSDKNQMKQLADDYKRSDLLIQDNSGTEVHNGDKVRITGMFSRPYTAGQYGSIDVQTIEKIEPIAPDYSKLGAANITIDTNGHAALEGKLVVAEGYLEIPTSVYTTETVYFDLFPTQNADDYLTVDIVIGTGPNLVEELPDNYGKEDVKIHDHKDMIVGNKKVRVYGVWKYSRIAAEFIEVL